LNNEGAQRNKLKGGFGIEQQRHTKKCRKRGMRKVKMTHIKIERVWS
jgi:hypothetical protein